MRLLVLAPFYPDAPSDGDRLRLYHWLRALGRRHDVTLLCFADPARPSDWKAGPLQASLRATHRIAWGRWQKMIAAGLNIFGARSMNVAAYASPAMNRAVDTLLATDSFDAVFAYRLRMAPYAKRARVARVLDLTDSLTRYSERRAATSRGLLRWFWSREAKRLATSESDAARQFDACLLNAECDRETLLAMVPGSKIILASNGVDPSCFAAPRQPKRGRLLFVGQLGYAPNTDAVLWMAREILPLILARCPFAELVIAGSSAPASILALVGQPGIRLLGFIPSVAEQLSQAAVVVVPVRFGAGRQNKLLEAFAAGVPSVTSSFGAMGAGARPEHDVLVGDDPKCFANAVISLLKSPALGTRVARNARALARRDFRWEKNVKVVEGALKNAIHQGAW